MLRQNHIRIEKIDDFLVCPKRRRTAWAQLLRRVLGIDALSCPRCSAPMIVLAFITDPGVVRKILDHLRLPSADPPRPPSRFERREEQVEMFEGRGDEREEGEAPAGRDPPGEELRTTASERAPRRT